MERLTKYISGYAHGAEGVSDDKLTGAYCRGAFEATACVERLAYYEDLEEQGLLPKFPCKVGDTVYFISERTKKQGRKKVVIEFVDKGIVDNITLGSIMIPQITVCNDENIWTTFDSVDDFGKTIFLAQAEADEALERMEGEKQ